MPEPEGAKAVATWVAVAASQAYKMSKSRDFPGIFCVFTP
jgi:hypothetical protein